MKATLSLEYIGESCDARLILESMKLDYAFGGNFGKAVIGNTKARRPWVAEIVDKSDKFGFDRRFLKGKIQYAGSNSTGSRGVELWFILESEHLYEVKRYTSWKSSERYFCTVTPSGGIALIVDVDQWLSDHSG